MKKWMRIALPVICILTILTYLSFKEKEEVLHLGLNVEVIEINKADQLLYVKGNDASSSDIFGDRCKIDCKRVVEEQNIIYVNYEAEHDVREIEFNDLLVGDHLILSLHDTELKNARQGFVRPEQIQLGTQRLS